MSDDLGAFLTKTNAMFDRAKGDNEEIVKVWMLKVATRLVLTTPGPGLQWPTTEYIATGRLRAGWNYGFSAPETVGSHGDGGEDLDGKSTIATMGAEISARGFQAVTFMWNAVGYGLYVHEGIGNHAHIGPRPWVLLTALDGQALLDQARAEVMGR